MQCPTCNTMTLEGDRFCEECGTRLMVESTVDQPEKNGCEKCGATADQMDAEGFCTVCGFRSEVSDRVEVTFSDRLAGLSDRGLRHHRNEDAIAMNSIAQGSVLVVCDGVSCSRDPQDASKIAAKTVCEHLTAALEKQDNPEVAMKGAIAAAQFAVKRLASPADRELDSPSTTIVAAIVQDNAATIGWLGDSRAYWISELNAKQLTHDDSWINEAIAAGTITEAETIHSPNAHAITRWIGADADDFVPSIVNFPISESGYLLLCSDGLWNYAPIAHQLSDLVHSVDSDDAIAISRSLVDYAIRAGGHDNISVVVLSL